MIWVTKDSERPLGKIGEALEYFYRIDPLISVFWKTNVKWPVIFGLRITLVVITA